MSSIAINGRFWAHKPTGMQRYAAEVAARRPSDHRVIRPRKPLKGAAGHLWEQLYIPSVLQQDLLWSPNNTGPVSVERQVCTIHDLIPLDRPEWFNRSFAAWYGWLLPRLVRKVRHIIAVSEFTASRLRDRLKVPAQKITVIHNGVHESYYRRPEAEVKQARAALGIGSRPYLLSVASLEPRKNLRRLMEAWARVPFSIDPGCILVIAGLRGSSKVFSDASLGEVPPRVLFPGYIPEEILPALITGATALVYPSLYEGFGLPPVEAMACGTPVITSNTTCLPEVTGDAALTVDPTSTEQIAGAIEEILRSGALRQTLVSRGLHQVRSMTWQNTAQQTWQLLGQVAK